MKLMAFLFIIFAVFVLLMSAETYWRVKHPRDEFSRKFIHITVGTFAAFWPWYLGRDQILILAGAFLLGVILSKYLNLFHSIHAVGRQTWGEVCFALAVGALALMTDNPVLYTVALLHMSLADGLAAIVGLTWGKHSNYKIFGQTKSVAGTLTFFVISLCLLAAYGSALPGELALIWLVPVAAAAALIENVSARGTDNLLVPLFVAITLLALG